MKRSGEVAFKPTKYALQTINSAGTPLTSFQWEHSGGNISSSTANKKPQIAANNTIISSLPPNTIIQTTGGRNPAAVVSSSSSGFSALTAAAGVAQIRRPTIYIKRDAPKRTIRSTTLELIENNPQVHLGVNTTLLPIIKNSICNTAGISHLDCYITLKKLRQNEEFSLLAEYFEMSELHVQQTFTRTVSKLARYMRALICWPNGKKYYDRHKNLPFAFRSDLSHVQSLIECVDTEIDNPFVIDCSKYKFILSLNPNGIISYVSDVFVGHHDDLSIFAAANFQKSIPKYLSMVAVPGKAVRRIRKKTTPTGETDSTTDSADESDMERNETNDDGRVPITRYTAQRVAAELVSEQTLNVVNNELKSRRNKEISIPTAQVREKAVCRQQIRQIIDTLREFKILQPFAIQEPMLYQYLGQALVVIAALVNMQKC